MRRDIHFIERIGCPLSIFILLTVITTGCQKQSNTRDLARDTSVDDSAKATEQVVPVAPSDATDTTSETQERANKPKFVMPVRRGKRNRTVEIPKTSGAESAATSQTVVEQHRKPTQIALETDREVDQSSSEFSKKDATSINDDFAELLKLEPTASERTTIINPRADSTPDELVAAGELPPEKTPPSTIEMAVESPHVDIETAPRAMSLARAMASTLPVADDVVAQDRQKEPIKSAPSRTLDVATNVADDASDLPAQDNEGPDSSGASVAKTVSGGNQSESRRARNASKQLTTKPKESIKPTTTATAQAQRLVSRNVAIEKRRSQTKPDGPTPLLRDTIRIRNVSRIGLPVAFALDGKLHKLYPGEVLDWPLSSQGQVFVQFHNGGRFGVDSQRLTKGSYEFSVTKDGWKLRALDSSL